MLVASGAEFGDACMAAFGHLSQVIGNIRTAIGCGTVRRASGIAVQVTVGDPVYQGESHRRPQPMGGSKSASSTAPCSTYPATLA